MSDAITSVILTDILQQVAALKEQNAEIQTRLTALEKKRAPNKKSLDLEAAVMNALKSSPLSFKRPTAKAVIRTLERTGFVGLPKERAMSRRIAQILGPKRQSAHEYVAEIDTPAPRSRAIIPT